MHLSVYGVGIPCLSLWERWPSAARSGSAHYEDAACCVQPVVHVLARPGAVVCQPARGSAAEQLARDNQLRMALQMVKSLPKMREIRN